jgi:Zn-dependent peptidase ImmA (M78 family)
MVRTQIYLTEAQHRALNEAAKREGISMTALLRRMIDRELFKSQGYAKDAPLALADLAGC